MRRALPAPAAIVVAALLVLIPHALEAQVCRGVPGEGATTGVTAATGSFWTTDRSLHSAGLRNVQPTELGRYGQEGGALDLRATVGRISPSYEPGYFQAEVHAEYFAPLVQEDDYEFCVGTGIGWEYLTLTDPNNPDLRLNYFRVPLAASIGTMVEAGARDVNLYLTPAINWYTARISETGGPFGLSGQASGTNPTLDIGAGAPVGPGLIHLALRLNDRMYHESARILFGFTWNR